MFERKRQIHGYDVTLSASYMEIYRDEVYDLFVDRESVGLVLESISG
jgi:kinesin family protein 22